MRWRLVAAVALAWPACAPRAPVESSLPHIPAPTLRPFADGREWLLVEPLTYKLGDSSPSITVPAGFVTDFASVPRAFWNVVAPHSYQGRAAIVHDFLYWDQSCTREEADGLFLLGMTASHVDLATKKRLYAAVRAHGAPSWQENARERSLGMPRIVPREFWALPDDVSWPAYRGTLFERGVRADTTKASRPDYCAVGRTVTLTDPS